MSGARVILCPLVSLYRWWGLVAVLLVACRTTVPAGPPRVEQWLPAFDPEAIADGRPPDLGPLPALAVRDYGPEGVLGDHPIRVRFNQPVVDMRRPAGERSDVALTLHALPAEAVDTNGPRVPVLDVRSLWTRSDTLELRLSRPLTPATRYEVTLPAGLRNRDGSTLGAVRWRFETARPQVEVLAEDEALLAHEPLYVTVDQPVDPGVLQRNVQVTAPSRPGGEPAAVAVRVRRVDPEVLPEPWRDYWWFDADDPDAPSLYAIEPAGRWPPGVAGILRVEAGLRGRLGPLPIAESYEAPFTIRDRLRVVEVECARRQGRSCAPGGITLVLSTEIDEPSLRAVKVSPRPESLSIEPGWGYDEGSTVEIDGEFVPGRSYVITVGQGLTDVHGQRLGRRWRRRFGVRRAPPVREQPGPTRLWLSSQRGTYLRPDQARVGIIGEHVAQARVRIAVFDASTLSPGLMPQLVPLLAADDLMQVAWPEVPTTVVERTLEPEGRDGRAEHVLDLSRYAGQGDAVLVELAVASPTEHGRADLESTRAPVRGLFQISDIGVVIDQGPARGFIRATRATRGRPWSRLTAQLYAEEHSQALPPTDTDGLVSLPEAESIESDAWIVLRDPTAGDRLVVPVPSIRWPSARGPAPVVHWMTYRSRRRRVARSEPPPPPPPGLRRGERAMLAVQLGRGVYLPGDSVHLAGWAGISTPYGEIATRRAKTETPVVVELRTGGRVVVSRRVEIDRHGRFSSTLPLPPGAPLGLYTARAQMLEGTAAAPFMLADTRLPTFEVTASARDHEGQGWLRGTDARVLVRADYLSGEPTPIEHLDWEASCHSTSFSHPALSGWTFRRDHDASPLERHGSRDGAVEPAAQMVLSLPTDGLDPLVPHWCRVSVAVQDATFQQSGADTSYFVHPTRAYVGLRWPDDPVAGTPLGVEVIAVARDGRRIAHDGVEVVIEREPEAEGRRKEHSMVEVARCSLELTAEQDPARCEVARPVVGAYRVRATTVVDGVPIRTDAVVVVDAPPVVEATEVKRSGASSEAPFEPEFEAGAEAESEASKPRPFAIHAPRRGSAGAPIDLRIEGPWDTARGLLTVEQTGLREARPFVLDGGEAVVTVTPRQGRGPLLDLRAIVATPQTTRDRPRVVHARDRVRLTEDRALAVDVEAPAKAAPGSEVSLRVRVSDRAGRPVDARVAVWVVDDAVHQLRGPYMPMLERSFNPLRAPMHAQRSSYDQLLRPFSPWEFGGRGRRAPRVRQAKAQIKGAMDLQVRQRFESVPLFEGNVGTGSDGVVELPLSLPDDLTRFVVLAVASAELPRAVGRASGPARFGRGEASLEVSAPLTVRTVFPRILRPGDEAELAALVTTPAGRPGTLTVEVERKALGGRLAWQGPTRVTRQVDGRGPTRVDFAVRAQGPGQPRVQMRARFAPQGSANRRVAAVERTLTIAVERTQVERAAIYGRIDADAPVGIPVRIPQGVRPDFGGLTLTLRSTALGDLDEAARYLEEYPYGCLEQTASRLLPLVALTGLADRLPAGVRDPATQWSKTLDHLLSMQRAAGDFTYWAESSEPAPYASAYATWVLQLAVDAGQPVPASALDRALDALEQRLAQPPPRTPWPQQPWWAERALVVHALAQAGRGQAPGFEVALDELYARRGALPLFAQALVLMAMHRVDPVDARVIDLRRRISASIEQTPSTAHPVERSNDRFLALFDSPARSHALTLMAWLQIEPDSPLVDKLARGLRSRRQGGRWRNTQENAYALLALSAYARAREAVAPDHRIAAWVGPTPLGHVEHRGHDTAARQLRIAMADLLGPVDDDGATSVVLDREGTGAAHYRLGMEWAATGDAPARSQGLSISRRLLEGSREPGEVLRAGRRYALEVVIDTDAPQRYLAVEIPLPAGLEAIQTPLGAGAAARSGLGRVGSSGWWVSHQELHGDRVLLFADALDPGRHVHTIPLLAATPGRFVLPAAVVEAMYTPEIRATTTRTRLRIEQVRAGSATVRGRARAGRR
ncbi:MAG: Ig-like domain-containing protein [Myxococcota bacterium]